MARIGRNLRWLNTVALRWRSDACLLWPYGSSGAKGYGRVYLPHHGMLMAHAVVCDHVHGPRPAGMQAAHTCGVNACVNPRHVYWATAQENSNDAVRLGERPRGEALGKLTENDVRAMRLAYSTGTTSYSKLGAEYGVGKSTVKAVITRRTWQHVL